MVFIFHEIINRLLLHRLFNGFLSIVYVCIYSPCNLISECIKIIAKIVGQQEEVKLFLPIFI